MVLVLGSGGCTRGSRVQRLLKAASHDFDAEKYDNAEMEYKNALRLSDMNPTAIGQLGRIYAKEGRLIDAQLLPDRSNVKYQPNSLPFQLALGQVDASMRDSSNAVKIALRILSAQPTNEEALLLMVDNLGSVQELRHVIESLPHAAENPGYHAAMGMLALRQKNLPEAESELRAAVAANPKSSHILLCPGANPCPAERRRKRRRQALQNCGGLRPVALQHPVQVRRVTSSKAATSKRPGRSCRK